MMWPIIIKKNISGYQVTAERLISSKDLGRTSNNFFSVVFLKHLRYTAIAPAKLNISAQLTIATIHR